MLSLSRAVLGGAGQAFILVPSTTVPGAASSALGYRSVTTVFAFCLIEICSKLASDDFHLLVSCCMFTLKKIFSFFFFLKNLPGGREIKHASLFCQLAEVLNAIGRIP